MTYLVLNDPRPPGRPKDRAKREAILDAAQKLFAESGLDGVAIETIAQRSGVSKVTVYANFRDKASIFAAVMEREADRLVNTLTKTAAQDGSLAERLTDIGTDLIKTLTDPRHVDLDKVMALEAQRNPALARRFFDAGPGRVRDLVSDVLAEAAARGEIAVENPSAAAADLLSLWIGFHLAERRFLCGEQITEDAIRPRAARAVSLILGSCVPRTA